MHPRFDIVPNQAIGLVCHSAGIPTQRTGSTARVIHREYRAVGSLQHARYWSKPCRLYHNQGRVRSHHVDLKPLNTSASNGQLSAGQLCDHYCAHYLNPLKLQSLKRHGYHGRSTISPISADLNQVLSSQAKASSDKLNCSGLPTSWIRQRGYRSAGLDFGAVFAVRSIHATLLPRCYHLAGFRCMIRKSANSGHSKVRRSSKHPSQVM